MIELPTFEGVEYEEKCEGCGKDHSMWTQSDNHPEYYTYVSLRCDCGHFVMFKLPVN